LDLSFSVDLLLSESEFLLHKLFGRGGTSEPGVSLDFFERESVSGLVLKHECDQTLEFLREEGKTSFLVRAVTLPEDVRSVESDLVIELVLLRVRSVEGRMAGHHNEEDNGG
jgi:hypothetical protein